MFKELFIRIIEFFLAKYNIIKKFDILKKYLENYLFTLNNKTIIISRHLIRIKFIQYQQYEWFYLETFWQIIPRVKYYLDRKSGN